MSEPDPADDTQSAAVGGDHVLLVTVGSDRRTRDRVGRPLLGRDADAAAKGRMGPRQQTLLAGDQWIADGDLGPYDVLSARLDRATHVVVLMPPTWLCCARALRRGRETLAFWRWTLTWQRREWPRIQNAIRSSPAEPGLLRLRTSREVTDAIHRTWTSD